MKKIFNIIVVTASVMLLAACHYEIDDVFDQSSAVRIQEEIQRVDEILKGAENGWLMEFYGASKYGGYNVFCKFNDDNSVLAQSEWYGENTATSHYKIEQSQGVLLSFDEYNEIIHFFSDPANPARIGDNGDGMLGDFEFRVMSASEDEVVLSGRKHGARVVMKAVAQDVQWNAYLAKVLDIEEKMSASGFIFTFGDAVVMASTNGYRQLSFADPESGNTVNVPYLVTDKGYLLYKELTFNGKTVSEFVYSEADEKCYAADDKTVSLEVRLTPLSEAIQNGAWFMSKAGMSAAALQPFLVADYYTNAGLGGNIQMMYIGNGDFLGYERDWGIIFIGAGYLGAIYLEPTIVDEDTISFAYKGVDGNGGVFVQQLGYSEIVKLLSTTFDLTTDNMRSPSYIKLQDTKNPDVYLTLSASMVMNPFQ